MFKVNNKDTKTTSGFLMFSGGIKRDQGHEMGYIMI